MRNSAMLGLQTITAAVGGLSAAADAMPSGPRNNYKPSRSAETKAKRKKAKLKRIAKRKQRGK
jgi:hypothetical protein